MEKGEKKITNDREKDKLIANQDKGMSYSQYKSKQAKRPMSGSRNWFEK